jgi:flagellin-like protein
MQKGISAVIATILLLLITIAVVGFASTFLLRTQTSVQGSVETSLQTQTSQLGTVFTIEGTDRNIVYIRNRGAAPLSGVAFYVSGARVNYTGPAALQPGAVGAYYLNDSTISAASDAGQLRVTSAGAEQATTADFYGRYTAGYWKFDEGSGTAAQDSAGGNSGILANGAAWTAGVTGSAVQFDGISGLVNMTDVLDFTGNSPYTLQALVKIPSIPSVNQAIIAKEGGSPRSGYFLFVQASSGRFFTERWVSGASVAVGSNTTAAPGTWYSLVATYNGSALRLYVNGVEEGTPINQTLAMPDTQLPFTVGSRSGVDSFLNGAVDEIKVLRVARSMNQE